MSEHADHPRPAPAAKQLRLADLLKAARPHLSDNAYSKNTRKVLHKLARCRSGDFGYAVVQCAGCGHSEQRPRGCGLRHCPSCGQVRAEDWIKARKLQMLDCPYYQLVFTLPPLFYPLAKENPELLYKTLFKAVGDTIGELAKDPKHLGGIPQFLLALHTWNGRLDYHLHIHALMAAGAYNLATKTWIPAKQKKFLFHIKVLSKLFRSKFLDELKRLHKNGLLAMERPANQQLQNPGLWKDFIDKAYATRFFTYVDKPAAGPENVLEYLGHYLYRTGISNSRLVSLENRTVTFRCKDRKKKVSTTGSYDRTLPLNDFVDLFAQHILPRGFHRIRFGGLWAPHHKARLPEVKEAVRRAYADRPPEPKPTPRPPRPPKPDICPVCKQHPMVLTCSFIFTKDSTICVNARARGPPVAPTPATATPQ